MTWQARCFVAFPAVVLLLEQGTLQVRSEPRPPFAIQHQVDLPPPTTNAVGGCPGTGDCCTAHGGSGCRDASCCNLICNSNPSCCEIGWTESCAGLAELICDESACVASGCPGSADCCTAHASRGCDDIGCCDAVCSSRPSCCSNTWSTTCANLADALCGTLCQAPPACPGTEDCCLKHLSPSCSDAACCEIVCAVDDFCCLGEWDELCAGKANDLCGEAQGNYCFETWCPGDGGSCCTAHGTGGCERAACCEIVCSETPSCCANFWSGGCTSSVSEFCVSTVCSCAKIGDLNADGRVNLSDIARVQTCFTGIEGGPIGLECACADDDGNGTVDPQDWSALPAALKGP